MTLYLNFTYKHIIIQSYTMKNGMIEGSPGRPGRKEIISPARANIPDNDHHRETGGTYPSNPAMPERMGIRKEAEAGGPRVLQKSRACRIRVLQKT